MTDSLAKNGYPVESVTYLNRTPVADAGEDMTVSEGDNVTLNGSGSFDPDADELIFEWIQISGPEVVLLNSDSEYVSFTAPSVGEAGETFTFEIRVIDIANEESTDSVTVFVNQLPQPAYVGISAQDAVQMIAANPDIVIIDVREPDEYCSSSGHIPDATNYPYNSGILAEKYNELPVNDTIILVCKSGIRSSLAGDFLSSAGFTDLYVLTSGMEGWESETESCGTSDDGTDSSDDDEDACFISLLNWFHI